MAWGSQDGCAVSMPAEAAGREGECKTWMQLLVGKLWKKKGNCFRDVKLVSFLLLRRNKVPNSKQQSVSNQEIVQEAFLDKVWLSGSQNHAVAIPTVLCSLLPLQWVGPGGAAVGWPRLEHPCCAAQLLHGSHPSLCCCLLHFYETAACTGSLLCHFAHACHRQ